MLTTLSILAGLLLLVKGGDLLVDGATAIAARARLSPMIIGLTVVGFGTSMPELLVSAQAAWSGSSGIAIGNVAGSNIANVALILGLAALFCPLPSSRSMMRHDMPFMLGALVALTLAAATGTIERWMGAAFLAAIATYVAVQVRHGRKTRTDDAPSPTLAARPLWLTLLLTLAALLAMILGSRLLVDGACEAARLLGRQFGADPASLERVLGLTVVAVGTSLPELVATVIAARRGETDMAVGNIIGSVTFNVLCVVGAAALIRPIPDAWSPFVADYFTMLGLALLLVFFLYTHRRIVRWEGAILVAAYAAYLASLLMA